MPNVHDMRFELGSTGRRDGNGCKTKRISQKDVSGWHARRTSTSGVEDAALSVKSQAVGYNTQMKDERLHCGCMSA
jgi:hypothetical protein